MYKNFFKRYFDIFFSLILIIFLSPIFISVFFLNLILIGSPFFAQRRVGLHGRVFVIYKFRSLIDKNDIDQKREYKFGSFLRKFGIDELPQLYNIIKNEMSFVGPRPLFKIKDAKIAKLRNSVKPGITGLAQINGNTMLSFERKMYYDLKYIKNINFKIDIKIIFKTLLIVLCGRKV